MKKFFFKAYIEFCYKKYKMKLTGDYIKVIINLN